jgi:acyl-CoA thioester hydrolase
MPELADYPFHVMEKLRYADTDRQGHVNNAVYAVLFEAGRVHLFRQPNREILPEGCEYVLARIAIDFRRELFWPGDVTVGTGLARIGRSSFTMRQAVFRGVELAAEAESVLVLTDRETRRSTPLPAATRAALGTYAMAEAASET